MRPLTEVSFCTSPFDLHVLGTPPAFVLSQDQTLKKIVLTLASLQVPISLSLIAHSILTYHFSLNFFRSPDYFRIYLRSKKSQGFFLTCCLIFKVRFALGRTPSRECLHIVPLHTSFVKHFYQVFLNFFKSFFRHFKNHNILCLCGIQHTNLLFRKL